MHASKIEHVTGKLAGQLNDIGRAAARKHLDGFFNLEGITDLPAQRHGHVGQERARGHPRVGAEIHHRAGELARGVQILHEGTRADLDVQDESARSLGDLLTHDGAGDQRNRFDRGRDVAQRVELLVRRCQTRPCRADDRAAAFTELSQNLLVGQISAPPGDGLHLVQGTARVPQASARQLRDGHAEARDERSQRKRDLVAHASRRVLVCGRFANPGEVHALPRTDHRIRPAGDLGAVHPTQKDRHSQSRHLLVLDDALRVGVDHPVNLVGGEYSPIPLRADNVNGIKQCQRFLLSSETRPGPRREHHLTWRCRGRQPPPGRGGQRHRAGPGSCRRRHLA